MCLGQRDTFFGKDLQGKKEVGPSKIRKVYGGGGSGDGMCDVCTSQVL